MLLGEYMKISKRSKQIEHSLSRELFNRAKQYDNVIDLTLGDPDLLPDLGIQEAACEAIRKGYTKYSANAGMIELRKAIAESTKKEYNISVSPNDELVVTVGGMEALFLSLSCLIDDGDEVIVFAPYYVNYIQMIRMCGGTPVIIETEESRGFQFSKEQLQNAITNKTSVMIINSPCNPTGHVISSEGLDYLAEVAIENDITIISDEVYRTLIYDDCTHDSIIIRTGMKERTVLVDSMSKRFSMTGYRLGYAIAPKDLIAEMTKMQENVAACAPLPSQHAGIYAYTSLLDNNCIRDEFAKRRDYIFPALNNISGLSCLKPEGTFYLFVNISDSGLNCLDFAYRLLEEQQVAVVPGITYGEKYTDYIRIAYTVNVDKLKEAVNRIEMFMSQFN